MCLSPLLSGDLCKDLQDDKGEEQRLVLVKGGQTHNVPSLVDGERASCRGQGSARAIF